MPFKQNAQSFAFSLALAALTSLIVQPVLAQSCPGKGGQRSNTRIVGGSLASIKHWPGQAVFRFRDAASRELEYFCGGAAIAPNWIITAAHCMKGINESAGQYFDARTGRHVQVQLGTDHLATGPSHVRQISQIITHEKYTSALKGGFDIALVKIASPWRGPFASLSLDPASDPVGAGGRVMVAGFGYTKGANGIVGMKNYKRQGIHFSAGSDQLLQTAVPMVAPTSCAARYPRHKIGKGQLCAGLLAGGQDSCNGDSGGPLVAYNKQGCPYQIGLVSWGPRDCGAQKSYGVYTRISHFSKWIKARVPQVRAIGARQTGERTTLAKPDVEQALRQIKKLFGTGGKLTLQVRVLAAAAPAPGNRVGAEDYYIFDISSAVAGRLILVDIGEDGKVTQIFPNKYSRAVGVARLRAGEQASVPGEGYGFDAFLADLPANKRAQGFVRGKLLGFVVPDDFKIDLVAGDRGRLSRGLKSEDLPTNYLMNLIHQMSTLHSQSGVEEARNKWAFAVMNYEIVGR